MSQPRPDPGATRKPPSWLVFEDDDPWLQFGSGLDAPENESNWESSATSAVRSAAET